MVSKNKFILDIRSFSWQFNCIFRVNLFHWKNIEWEECLDSRLRGNDEKTRT